MAAVGLEDSLRLLSGAFVLITEMDMTRHIQRSVDGERGRDGEKDDDYMLYHLHRQTRNAKK